MMKTAVLAAMLTMSALSQAEPKHIFNDGLLGVVEMLVLVGKGDGLRTRKHRLDLVLSFAHSAEDFLFRCNGLGGCELTAWDTLATVDDLKFPGGQTGVKVGADLSVGDLTHAAPQPVADQSTFIDNCFALEVFVARKGKRFADTVN